MKAAYLLPNLVTLASLYCGLSAIMFCIEDRFDAAAWAILASCLFDGLDGKLARITKTTSEFGVQLDSLCDLVAFGIAPGILAWQWTLSSFGRMGLLACFAFAACGAMRLARFNVMVGVPSKGFFVGLPIPAAGCTLATLVLFAPNVPEFIQSQMPLFTLCLMYGLAALMISRVRYLSFKDASAFKLHPYRYSILLVTLLWASVVAPKLVGFPLMATYIILGLVHFGRALLRRDSLRDSFPNP